MDASTFSSIIVGTRECPISKVHGILTASPAFAQFHDKLWDLARSLEVPNDKIRMLNKRILWDQLNISDALNEVIETWVAAQGTEATLDKLAIAIEINGLKNFAELLLELDVARAEEEKSPKLYARTPTRIQSFLNASNTQTAPSICILLTPDFKITSQKLQENIGKCSFPDPTDFLNIISRHKIAKGLFVVTINDMALLKQLVVDASHNMQGKLILLTKKELKNELANLSRLGNMQIFTDEMDWKDLTPTYKQEIRRRLMETTQLELELEVGGEENMLYGQIIVDLINGRKPKLFREMIPPKLSYYVERTLVTRSVISSEIFMSRHGGLFLFEGIERWELSRRTGKSTDNSTNQIRKRSGSMEFKFMVLDHPDHFEDLCELTGDTVHWLRWEKEKISWVKTRGDLAVIQKYVDSSQDNLAEENLLENLAHSKLPVCICDSPGMGKSVLLAQLGTRLGRLHPDKTIIFMNSTEFIRELVRLNGRETDDKLNSIEVTLQNLASANNLGRAALKSILWGCRTIKIELLLDGFDELAPAGFKLGLEILQIIQSSLPAIRLWVTSRPHLLEKLEAGLNILGYKIKPFTDEDQVKAVTSYWAEDIPSSSHLSLSEFAIECLHQVKSNLKKKEQDIAGIPLQCHLIGKAYKREATHFAKHGARFPLSKQVFIDSISTLFEHFIEQSIQLYVSKYGKKSFNREKVKSSHAKLGIQLIFPDYSRKLNGMFDRVAIGELLKVGILERASSEENPRFIHRTFAEYFVAWFVADKLGCEESWWLSFLRQGYWLEELTEFVFKAVLLCEKDEIQRCEFLNPVICKFLDSLLPISDHQNIFRENLPNTFHAENYAGVAAKACVYEHLSKIFKFFNQVEAFKTREDVIFDESLVNLAVRFSSVEVIKLILPIFERHHKYTAQMQSEILRETIKRGEFSILQFLLYEKKLCEILPEMQMLLHDCVAYSHRNSESVIKDKIQIVRMLVNLKPSLLEEKDERGMTALLAVDVNAELMLELVALGADVTTRDEDNETVLHLSVQKRRYISPEDYHRLIVKVSENRSLLRALLDVVGSNQCNFIEDLLIFLSDPMPETLDVLKNAGINFAKRGASGRNLLQTAVEARKKSEILRKLIECGAEVLPSHLHIAAEHGNLDAVDLLIGEFEQDVNAEDENGLSPLDRAIRSVDKSGKRFEVGAALHRLGGKFNKTLNPKRQSLLHIAAQDGNIPSMQILLHLGIEVDWVDIQGNTALHLGLEQHENWSKNYFEIAKLLLDNGAVPDVENFEGMKPLDTALKNREMGGDMDLRTLHLLNWLPNSQQSDSIEMEADCDENGDSPLHVAAELGDEKEVIRLIRKYPHLRWAKNKWMQTPLHYAIHSTQGSEVHMRVIKCLIDNGIDVYAKDDNNNTFLHSLMSLLGDVSPSSFHSLVEFLVSRSHSKLFDIPGGDAGMTPFQYAVMNVDIEGRTLSLMHSQGVNFDAADRHGNSILEYAVTKQRNMDILAQLIRFGADCSRLNDKKQGMLHSAAHVGTYDALRFFLEMEGAGLDVNCRDWKENTPLFYALTSEHEALQKSRLLVAKGVDVNWANNKKIAPLHRAVFSKDRAARLQLIKLLLDHKADVYAKEIKNNSTFLHVCIEKEDRPSPTEFHSLVEYLIEISCSDLLNVPDFLDENTLLQTALLHLELEGETLSLLHANYVNFNALNKHGKSVLDFAVAGKRSTQLLSSLIQFGADWKRLGGRNSNMLHTSCFKNLFKLLDTPDEGGKTPFQLALLYLDVQDDTLGYLYATGVNFNAVDKSGNSVLTHAVDGNRNVQLLATLIRLGADWKHLSNDKCSILHSAAQNGSYESLNFFLDLGGLDVNGRDGDGDSPLHCALATKQGNAVEKCKLLIDRGAEVKVPNNSGRSPLSLALAMTREGSVDRRKLVALLTKSIHPRRED